MNDLLKLATLELERFLAASLPPLAEAAAAAGLGRAQVRAVGRAYFLKALEGLNSNGKRPSPIRAEECLVIELVCTNLEGIGPPKHP